jgi:hypothetical protein
VPEAYLWWLIPRVNARMQRIAHRISHVLIALRAHAHLSVVAPRWRAFQEEVREATAVDEVVRAQARFLHAAHLHLFLTGNATGAQAPLAGLLSLAVDAAKLFARISQAMCALTTAPFEVRELSPARNYQELIANAPRWWRLRARTTTTGSRHIMVLRDVIIPVGTESLSVMDILSRLQTDCAVLDNLFVHFDHNSRSLHSISIALAEKGVSALAGLEVQLCGNGYFDNDLNVYHSSIGSE